MLAVAGGIIAGSFVVQRRLAVTLCGQATPDHDHHGKLFSLVTTAKLLLRARLRRPNIT
jgi:hypothetical protein